MDEYWYNLPMEDVWRIFSFHLNIATLSYGIRIHSFVLMRNHYHMLVTTPNANLDKAMHYLQTQVSKHIGKEAGRINHIFAGPYHRTLITSLLYYEHAYKYSYRNPVEAGLCTKVEDYRFSTLSRVIGKFEMTFPVFDNLRLIVNLQNQLDWLNHEYPSPDFWGDLKRALRHPELKFKASRNTQRISPLAYKRF